MQSLAIARANIKAGRFMIPPRAILSREFAPGNVVFLHLAFAGNVRIEKFTFDLRRIAV
ncbi:MAG: hypothetical protein WB787_13300 [Candidatus Acidiferrales bacterium]